MGFLDNVYWPLFYLWITLLFIYISISISISLYIYISPPHLLLKAIEHCDLALLNSWKLPGKNEEDQPFYYLLWDQPVYYTQPYSQLDKLYEVTVFRNGTEIAYDCNSCKMGNSWGETIISLALCQGTYTIYEHSELESKQSTDLWQTWGNI